MTVKFFGLISLDNNLERMEVPSGTVKEIIQIIAERKPGLDEQRLKQAIVFVNKKEINGNKRYSLTLEDGDELVFLNPSSGG